MSWYWKEVIEKHNMTEIDEVILDKILSMILVIIVIIITIMKNII